MPRWARGRADDLHADSAKRELRFYPAVDTIGSLKEKVVELLPAPDGGRRSHTYLPSYVVLHMSDRELRERDDRTSVLSFLRAQFPHADIDHDDVSLTLKWVCGQCGCHHRKYWQFFWTCPYCNAYCRVSVLVGNSNTRNTNSNTGGANSNTLPCLRAGRSAPLVSNRIVLQNSAPAEEKVESEVIHLSNEHPGVVQFSSSELASRTTRANIARRLRVQTPDDNDVFRVQSSACSPVVGQIGGNDPDGMGLHDDEDENVFDEEVLAGTLTPSSDRDKSSGQSSADI